MAEVTMADTAGGKSSDTFGTMSITSEVSGMSNLSSQNSAEAQEREEDFTKDNVASPIDLECHIQSERITKILDEAIYKTKLAVCLPDLVHEYRTLASILSQQNMDDLIFIFDQYDSPLFSTSMLNMAAMEDLKSGDLTMRNRLNPELGHLIYVLNSYPKLKPTVENMITTMKEEYKSKRNSKFNASLEYLMTLEQFRNQMVIQMNTTAAEELGAKLQTRKLENSNKNYIESIKEYTKTLKEENESFENIMKVKAEIINKLEYELALLHQDATIKLNKKILDSERQMVLATRAHDIKYELLKEEEIEVKEAYNTMLQQHIIDEKNLRARRFKVETQLMSWLQKYDLEMGDKQAELDELTEMYEKEVEKCEELEEKLAEQDKEYIPLMEEREAEYHAEMAEKMRKFMLEHAARVIQVAWRNVVSNRHEKKKLRKLLKLKQAAEERAAAQAAVAAAKAAKAARAAAKAARLQAKAEARAKAKEAKQAQKQQEEEDEADDDDDDDIPNIA